MRYFYSPLFIWVLLSIFCVKAQQYPYKKSQTTSRLKQHVTFLAADKLEGRLVGSKGEEQASIYIAKQYKKSAVTPATGTQNYLQTFSFKRLTYASNTLLSYSAILATRKVTLSLPVGYTLYPLDFSGVGSVTAPLINVGYGITTETGDYDDYRNVGAVQGKIVSINADYPNRNMSKEFARYADLEARADSAIRRGAVGIIFYTQDSATQIPNYKQYFTYSSFHGRKNVPIVFSAQSNLSLGLVHEPYQIDVDTVTKVFEGHNVIGWLDNKAATTVVIGAHYDHLGYNELGGSTYISSVKNEALVHNGADDNASGTAALMELAKTLSKSSYKRNNYLFVAFSGEEEGLLGSNYLVNHLPVDKNTINYMINMDMVGRLDTSKHSFAINGTGTSPVWEKVLDSIMIDGLKVKYSQSGSGSSDHASFYVNGIPVLHYFTGSHSDYHKPSDDEALINYDGMYSIVKHIYTLVGALDSRSKLSFTPTKEYTATKATFKVTLGIMPDYLFEGKGVKVDGATPSKPAANAGILKGDVIIQLGNISIDDMQTYMKALGKFNKGQTTKVKVLRAEKELFLDVTF